MLQSLGTFQRHRWNQLHVHWRGGSLCVCQSLFAAGTNGKQGVGGDGRTFLITDVMCAGASGSLVIYDDFRTFILQSFLHYPCSATPHMSETLPHLQSNVYLESFRIMNYMYNISSGLKCVTWLFWSSGGECCTSTVNEIMIYKC